MTHPNPLINTVKVAFLEDDQAYASKMIQELQAMGYEVTHFIHGHVCLNHLVLHDHDVCLFDWSLPDMPGPEVMKRLRTLERMPPVIFLTGHDAESDVVEVLSAGADDYVVKPSTSAVLCARIEALLRRSRASHLSPVHKEILGHLTIDHQNKVVLSHGEPVALTGSETILAFEFFLHRGLIVTRQHLYERLGVHYASMDTRRLDVHISHLRKKLTLNAVHGWRLISVYQRGYRLEYLYETLSQHQTPC